ncbi:MAG: glutamate racemase [Desulfobacterales bacterium]|nr:glutamate racemase [Desulfobacterales bacterium]
MIGIFDSGMGGLTTVRAIIERLPGYDLVYFGDNARTPYGNKSRETIIHYALQNTEFLLSQGAKIIIVACNTASSVATDSIQQTYHVPLFEVISPAVDCALQTSKHLQIGVIGTKATISSNIYPFKIKAKCPEARVFSQACPLLVPLVEEGWLNKPETRMIVKKYLIPLKTRQIDTLILGCTHYPLLKKSIQAKIGKRTTIIDSSIAVADSVADYLQSNPEIDSQLSKQGQTTFYVSDVTEHFQKTAETILKRRVHLNYVRL